MIEFDDDLMEDCYDVINDLLIANKFKAVDLMLRIVSVPDIDINGMITLLTITNMAYDKLPYRETFYKLVEEELIKREEPDLKGLLGGLKGMKPSPFLPSLGGFGIYDPNVHDK